mmetsp:Transcript_56604/g.122320  ORF Transcript_56604/g.122320 Transcript_56604/m.122320 type:complete len:387 (+) Transcript_56604:60-1220(+)
MNISTMLMMPLLLASSWGRIINMHQDQLHEERRLNDRGLMLASVKGCQSIANLSLPIVREWEHFRPKGTVQTDDGGNGCLMKKGTHWSMLTLVNHTSNNICYDGAMTSKSTAYSFPVNGTLRDRAGTRNIFVISPKGKCSAEKPCPVVFYLHGHDEHVSSLVSVGGYAAQDEAWDKAMHSGFMRYAHQADCAATLGSVLIFPQLLDGESWVENGASLLQNFVVPVVQRHRDGGIHGYWDLDRVAIMGYSEGSEGVIQAAKLYPHIFRLAIAAAPTTPTSEQLLQMRSAALELRATQKRRSEAEADRKLSLFIASFGEEDKLGSSQLGLSHLMYDLDVSGVTSATRLHVRLYLGAGHVHWDEMFNRWPALHSVLWRGDYTHLERLGQ